MATPVCNKYTQTGETITVVATHPLAYVVLDHTSSGEALVAEDKNLPTKTKAAPIPMCVYYYPALKPTCTHLHIDKRHLISRIPSTMEEISWFIDSSATSIGITLNYIPRGLLFPEITAEYSFLVDHGLIKSVRGSYSTVFDPVCEFVRMNKFLQKSNSDNLMYRVYISRANKVSRQCVSVNMLQRITMGYSNLTSFSVVMAFKLYMVVLHRFAAMNTITGVKTIADVMSGARFYIYSNPASELMVVNKLITNNEATVAIYPDNGGSIQGLGDHRASSPSPSPSLQGLDVNVI